MKRVILFLAIVLFAGMLKGQTVDTTGWKFKFNPNVSRYTDVENKKAWMGQDSGMVDVKIVYPLPTLYNSIYTDPDTSGIFRCTLDSIPISANVLFDINAYTTDSTIFLCFTRTFPLHSVIPIPPGSYTAKQWDIGIASYGYLYKKTQTRKHSITINKR